MKHFRLLLSKRKAAVLAAGAGAFGVLVTGCGGGGGTSAPSDPLAAGRSVLQGLASGQTNVSNESLSGALKLFQQAKKTNPGSSQALFGEAVTLAAMSGLTIDDGTVSSNNSGGSAGSGGGGIHLPGRGTHAVTRGNEGSVGGSPGTGLIPEPPTSGTLPPALPGDTTTPPPVPAHNQLCQIWMLNRGLSNPYTLLEMLGPIADLRFGLLPFNGYFGDSGDVTRRQKLLADLNTAADDLVTVEADPNFTYTLPAPDQNGNTVTIGLPEVYLFDAYINSLRSQIALSLAYVRDRPIDGGITNMPLVTTVTSGATPAITPPGIVVQSAPTPGVNGVLVPFFSYLDVNQDGKLEPSEYLPASPYLTLRDASYLQTAQKAIAATADREQKGITGVLARPTDGSGGFLIPNSPAVTKVLTRINNNVVPVIAQAAVGPFTLKFPRFVVNIYGAVLGGSSGGVFEQLPMAIASMAPPGVAYGGNPIMPDVMEVKVNVNLAAWFANPPVDLKAFAPTYPLTSDSFPSYSNAIYPDPTYGGLFPDGLPTDLLM